MSYATRAFDSRLRTLWAVRVTVLSSIGVLSGCLGGGIRVEPLTEGFAPTRWETVEVFETSDEIQRDFTPLGMLHGRPQVQPLRRAAVDELRREASRIGANAIVLQRLDVDGRPGSDRTSTASDRGADRGGWSGTATALRIVEPRWGDRYWRFGDEPAPLIAQSHGFADAPAIGWTRLQEWAGLDDLQTESFWIPSGEWRVKWQAGPRSTGSIEVLIYSLPNDVLVANIGQDGSGGGTYLGLAERGEFYLKINASDVDWEIAVDTWTAQQR